MIENIVTEEQLKEMVEKVWASCREGLEKDIYSAIRQEMHHNISSMAHRLVAERLRGILIPMIDERMAAITEAAKKIVDSHFKQVEAKVLDEVESRNLYHVENAFDQVAKEMVSAMKTAARQVVTERRSEIQKGTPL